MFMTFNVDAARLDRRTLLQGLAAMAAVGTLPRSSFAAAAPLVKITEMNHMGISTLKVNETRDFYVKLFGFKADTMEDNVRAYVRFPGGFISINKGAKASLGHNCFGVPGFDSKNPQPVIDQLKKAGFDAALADAASIFVKDPSGLLVQIGVAGFDGLEAHDKKVAPPAASAPAKPIVKVKTLNHFAVLTDKVNETRDWYVKLFGMTADTIEDNNRVYVRAPGGILVSINKTYFPGTPSPSYSHYAFGIEDFDEKNPKATIDMLKKAGFDARPADAVSLMVRDPNGLDIQLGSPEFTGLEDHPKK
jgi:catechol 2,3-dioxygenase-like lactoylglutathione lyase family enzyme